MLKIGVIGCGAIGRDHIRRLHDLVPGCEVVACADYFKAAADKVAEQYGITAYETGEELIAAPEVEAVVITSATVSMSCRPSTITSSWTCPTTGNPSSSSASSASASTSRAMAWVTFSLIRPE